MSAKQFIYCEYSVSDRLRAGLFIIASTELTITLKAIEANNFKLVSFLIKSNV